MSIGFEPRQGAVEFTRRSSLESSVPNATFFTRRQDDCVDENWGGIIGSILSIAKLENDWDGEHAVVPEQDVIAMAAELAKQLRDCSHPAPLRAVAGVNGTISFEFGGEPFFEIEVVSATRAEVFESGRLVLLLTAE